MDLDGNVVKEFVSARAASRHLNIDVNKIWRACNGQKKVINGYRFEYLDNKYEGN